MLGLVLVLVLISQVWYEPGFKVGSYFDISTSISIDISIRILWAGSHFDLMEGRKRLPSFSSQRRFMFNCPTTQSSAWRSICAEGGKPEYPGKNLRNLIKALSTIHTSAFSFETAYILMPFRPSVYTKTLSVFGETAPIWKHSRKWIPMKTHAYIFSLCGLLKTHRNGNDDVILIR